MYKSNNLVVGNRDHFNWPPPPPLEMVSWSMKRPCPPKPDTPPSPVSNCFFLIIYFYIIIFHHHNEYLIFFRIPIHGTTGRQTSVIAPLIYLFNYLLCKIPSF